MGSHSDSTSSGAASHGPQAPHDGLPVNIFQSHCEGVQLEREVRAQGKSHESNGYATTIDRLSDDILFDIFHSYRSDQLFWKNERRPQPWKWYRLVHVCRRWRQIIFASPNSLDIRLRCTDGTPVRSHLSYWPALPIVINYIICGESPPSDEDNLIAALGHSNRVCVIDLYVMTTQLVKLVTAMRQSYPALTHLTIMSNLRLDALVLPRGFLGGSAPCLQRLTLGAIPFPALPKLLLSASHLIELHLRDIPKTGYISPEEIVVSLAALTSLKFLCITFRSAKSRPRRTSPGLVTRAALPALTCFEFRGVSEYLEDFLARIDCPQINRIDIRYLHRPVGFQAAQLFQFINRLENPRLTQFGWLFVYFLHRDEIRLKFYHTRSYDAKVEVSFVQVGPGWELSNVVRMFGYFSTRLSGVRHLSIIYYGKGPGLDHDEWMQILHPFTAVRTLKLFTKYEGFCIPMGQAGETFADLLPALSLLYLDYECAQVGFFGQFIAARRRSGRPVTVARYASEFYDRLDLYLSEQDNEPYRPDSPYI